MSFINSLVNHELIYEISLRDVKGSEANEIEKNQSILRGLIMRYKRLHQRALTNKFQRADDLAGISDSLASLTQIVEDMMTPIDSELVKIVTDRLMHVELRLERVAPLEVEGSDDYDQVEMDFCYVSGEFHGKLASIDSSVPVVIPPPTVTVSVNGCPQINPAADSVLPFASSGAIASGVSQSTTSVPSSAEIICKWGLKFTGKDPGNLLDFLEKVEDLKSSRSISDESLFQSAYFLFDSEALQWFRNNRSRVRTWEELAALLKKCFLPHNFDSEIHRELSDTYQREMENVSVFIAKSENLFARLTAMPPDSVRVNLIREHLLPYFIQQTASLNFNHVDELNDICVKLEKSRICSARAEQVLMSDRKRMPRISAAQTVEPITGPKCWNCRTVGHTFFNCGQPRSRRFCYSCGNLDFTISTCPKCKKNSRSGRGQGQPTSSDQN